jgi:hypothetical protein
MKNTSPILRLGFVRVSTLNFTTQSARPLSDCLRLTDRPQRTLIEVIWLALKHFVDHDDPQGARSRGIQ